MILAKPSPRPRRLHKPIKTRRDLRARRALRYAGRSSLATFKCRTLFAHFPHRRRRHGRRLQGPPPRPRPRRRGQVPARAPDPAAGDRRALPPRGPAGRPAAVPGDRPRLRLRRDEGHYYIVMEYVDGQTPGGAHRRAAHAAGRPGPADRRGGRPGAARGARPDRPDPPRRQAGQHPAHPQRAGEARRPGAGQGRRPRRRPAATRRPASRWARPSYMSPEQFADASARRSPGRHLLARRDALPDARGPAAVPRRLVLTVYQAGRGGRPGAAARPRPRRRSQNSSPG